MPICFNTIAGLINNNFNFRDCIDMDFEVILNEKSWLEHQLFGQLISRMTFLLKIHGIDLLKYETDEYVTVPLYLLGEKNNGAKSYTFIWRKLHLVDGLKANILISNNIIGLKGISVNISSKLAYISSYKIKLWIEVKQWGPFVWQKVLSKANIVLPFYIKKVILFSISDLLDKRNFLFHLFLVP